MILVNICYHFSLIIQGVCIYLYLIYTFTYDCFAVLSGHKVEMIPNNRVHCVFIHVHAFVLIFWFGYRKQVKNLIIGVCLAKPDLG